MSGRPRRCAPPWPSPSRTEAMPRRVVIVGASAAGLTAAEALRRRGYDGTLTLIGDEPHLPYDRPPLSKQILAGTWQPQRIRLRDEQALAGLDADLLLGWAATGLDAMARRAHPAGGAHVDYDARTTPPGVRPRPPPRAGLAARPPLARRRAPPPPRA